jgi:GTP pyrophosphokinase
MVDFALLRPHFDAVIDALREHDSRVDISLVERAYRTAQEAHSRQWRKSGEPYLIHPLRVASTIARLGLGPASVAAGLMHDSIEDSDLTVYAVTEKFGREVANLVDGVTKLGKVPYLSRREQQAESFRKMLLAMSQDIRVLLVKLADRLDNMQTLRHMPEEKQRRIARETMDIYSPLAGRLGIDWVRNELADLSFRYLEPTTYESTHQRMDALLEESPSFVGDTLAELHQAFVAGSGTDRNAFGEAKRWDAQSFGEVELRASTRTVYKVHNFEGQADRDIDHSSDLVTYQVITLNRVSAYAALGRVHAAFKPVPGRFRDYVALPRPNRYQALHTTVVNEQGSRLEVQIRSETMDAVAERGVAFELGAGRGHELQSFEWLEELLDWEGEVRDPNEFIEAVKAELFADEVYAFTPGGDLHTFPKGATPIDFAFAIHTDVGLRCAGARVNGHVVPLRYKLRQGDTVEIMTGPNPQPKVEWLKMCGSSRARAKIKHFLRTRERERLRTIGREMLMQGAPESLEALDGADEGVLHDLLERLSVSADGGLDGVFEELGAGRLRTKDVLWHLDSDRQDEQRSNESLVARVFRRMSGRQRTGWNLAPEAGAPGSPLVIRQSLLTRSGGVVQLAACCAPVPGDELVGLLSGNGIVAHVQGCPGALEHVDERRIFLAWDPDVELEQPLRLRVRTANMVGLLAEMSRAFSHLGVNIKEANCRAIDGGKRAMNTFHATVRTLDQVDELDRTLRGIKGVMDVQRVLGQEQTEDPTPERL